MLIDTIHGQIPESDLKKVEEVIDNENEYTEITEYWQLVHRSVHVTVKHGTVIGATLGKFGE